MMQIHPLKDVQAQLLEAFEAGLRTQWGEELARLGRHVAEYRPGVRFGADELRRSVELDTAPVLKDIVANQVTGATLRALRSVLMGCALQADRSAVERWATELLTRCPHAGGEWPGTAPLWQTVLKNPDEFIRLARQIKYFLNQV
jgi:hypothetical protein